MEQYSSMKSPATGRTRREHARVGTTALRCYCCYYYCTLLLTARTMLLLVLLLLDNYYCY